MRPGTPTRRGLTLRGRRGSAASARPVELDEARGGRGGARKGGGESARARGTVDLDVLAPVDVDNDHDDHDDEEKTEEPSIFGAALAEFKSDENRRRGRRRRCADARFGPTRRRQRRPTRRRRRVRPQRPPSPSPHGHRVEATRLDAGFRLRGLRRGVRRPPPIPTTPPPPGSAAAWAAALLRRRRRRRPRGHRTHRPRVASFAPVVPDATMARAVPAVGAASALFHHRVSGLTPPRRPASTVHPSLARTRAARALARRRPASHDARSRARPLDRSSLPRPFERPRACSAGGQHSPFKRPTTEHCRHPRDRLEIDCRSIDRGRRRLGDRSIG